jgi:MFS family permease
MSQNTGNSPRLGIAVLCVAQFVVVLDVTVVATALPAIGADLGASGARLGAVVTAYTVAMAGLLVLGGRVADVRGAAPTFRWALVGFAVASAACALAWSPTVLVAARVIQGVAAALLSPAALAVLQDLTHADAAARRRALGWWTAAAAGGGASGWVLGGVLLELAGWRWVFAVNVPIGLLAVLVGLRALPTGTRAGAPAPGRAGRRPTLDTAGAVLVTVAIAAAVLGLSLVAERPAAWAGWALLAGAALLSAVFVRHERRSANPLLPGPLVTQRGVRGGNLTAVALTASTSPAMLTVVWYAQEQLQLAPARASLLFPAFNLAVVAGALVGPHLLPRLGTQSLLLAGFTAVVAGTLLLLTLPDRGLPLATLLGSFVLMGAGLGLASLASTTAGTADIAADDQGVSAGLLASSAQLGTAVGVAATTPLVAGAGGYHLSFLAAAAVAVAGAAASLIVPGRRPVDLRPQPEVSVGSGYPRSEA